MEELFFNVGSGLKSLIWKESITDRNVAIFELVKNSIDARARHVRIKFYWKRISDSANQISHIEIFDDGKWMGIEDINNKWLKVAFSAKKEGTEDDGISIPGKIYYAWAKGVGRFACDTLWSRLDIYSNTEQDLQTEHLQIDWADFESNLNNGFQDIPIRHETIQKQFKQGVRILISGIRDSWSRDDLKKLKRGLIKLIQPRLAWDKSEFTKIFLEADFEEEIDLKQSTSSGNKDSIKHYYESVNWEIKNFAFEELNQKTIQIRADIIEDWAYLKISLLDKGEEIYFFKQVNEYPLLHDISVHLSFLDKWAKSSFFSTTWIHSKDYGSIFVYKNWFRILPYWNSGDDSFWIDLRKAQGYSRFLGNREIVGQVVILGENNWFFETTNRDGGFIKNSTFLQFREFLISAVLTRFEKYIRAVRWYGLDELVSWDDEEDATIWKVNEDIAKVIASIERIKGLVEFRYSDLIEDLLKKNVDFSTSIKRIEESLSSSWNSTELKSFVELSGKYKELWEKDKKARKIIEAHEKAIKDKESALSAEKEKNRFLLATSRNSILISELAHHLKNYSSGLQNRLSAISNKVGQWDIDPKFLLKATSECLLLSSKIDKFVQFSSIANFDLQSSQSVGNLIEYIKEYIEDSKKSIPDVYEDVVVRFSGMTKFETAFTPMDISIVLDNLFSNAAKAMKKYRVTEKIVELEFQDADKGGLMIIFSNFGPPIPDSIKNRMFDIGFSTTPGWSGLGLNIVKEILEENWGTIVCENHRNQDRTSFVINIPLN